MKEFLDKALENIDEDSYCRDCRMPGIFRAAADAIDVAERLSLEHDASIPSSYFERRRGMLAMKIIASTSAAELSHCTRATEQEPLEDGKICLLGSTKVEANAFGGDGDMVTAVMIALPSEDGRYL
ncbi:MAG: hypothetical protein AAF413_00800 [Patescibacteria group bacterium]